MKETKEKFLLWQKNDKGLLDCAKWAEVRMDVYNKAGLAQEIQYNEKSKCYVLSFVKWHVTKEVIEDKTAFMAFWKRYGLEMYAELVRQLDNKPVAK
jgi:hypothetical protein